MTKQKRKTTKENFALDCHENVTINGLIKLGSNWRWKKNGLVPGTILQINW